MVITNYYNFYGHRFLSIANLTCHMFYLFFLGYYFYVCFLDFKYFAIVVTILIALFTVRTFVRLFVCLFVPLFLSLVRSFVRSFVCLFVFSFVRSFVQSCHWRLLIHAAQNLTWKTIKELYSLPVHSMETQSLHMTLISSISTRSLLLLYNICQTVSSTRRSVINQIISSLDGLKTPLLPPFDGWTQDSHHSPWWTQLTPQILMMSWKNNDYLKPSL